VFFQIPVGLHPFPAGAVVTCDARPWWGRGTVFVARGGLFAVRWADGMVSKGRHATSLPLSLA